MNKKISHVLLGFLLSTILAACGPSQAELDAQATQIAANLAATQTAEAPTFTPTATSTNTPTNTPTATHTPLPTDTPTPTFTHTPTPTPTDTPTPTATSTPLPTPTFTTIPPTNTLVPPTVMPTPTPAPPTATPIPLPTPTPALGIGSTIVRERDGATMVYVPAGEFLMGSAGAPYTGPGSEKEHPQHTVYLDAYWIDQTEVTNAQYNQCVTGGVCAGGNFAPEWTDYPVSNVNWDQAQTFCQWAGGRLPTEAEWEKAARGTDGRTYPWGEGINCTLARYDGEGCSTEVLPVGSLPAGASPYGALDMAGNVAEWVADWLDVDYYEVSPRENPPGPETSRGIIIQGATANVRVVRGSNPYADRSGITNAPVFLRTTNRDWNPPTSGTLSLGFRCAQSP